MTPSQCPICKRIYCNHTHTERSQTFAQMMGDVHQCGKNVCIKPAVGPPIYGSLTYHPCDKHRAEIQALVDSE